MKRSLIRIVELSFVIIIIVCSGFLLFKFFHKLTISQSTPSITIGQRVAAQPPVTQSQQHTVLDSVITWIPDVTWTKPVVTSLQTEYGELSGREIKTTFTSQKSYYGNFEQKDTLSNTGFVEDMNIAAGGPLGDVWGYKKDTTGQRQVLILSFSIKPPASSQGPIQITCPCQITLSAFLSNPFTPKQ